MSENGWKRKLKWNAAAFLIATAGTLCFPQILNLRENMLGFTNSIFSVFVWLLCLYAVDRSLQAIDLYDVRGWRIAALFSLCFTAAMLFGVRLEAEGNVDFKDVRLWIALPVLTIFFTILVRRLWDFLSGFGERRREDRGRIRIPDPPERIAKYADLLPFFFLLLCWLPVFLAVYPGFFVYDAFDEWRQVDLQTFRTHHPLAHVLLLGGIVNAVHEHTGSYNRGIACYTILQALIAAGGFACLLSFMRRSRVSAGIRILTLLYFAFFPVIVMFVLCSAKDTLFTVALLLLLLSLLDMGREREAFFASRRKMCLFALCAAAMMLFRRNGVYAFALMVPVLLFYQRAHIRKLCLLCAAAFLAFFLINGGLASALHAEDGEYQELLTVPIQQLARTYKFNKDVFTEEDIDTLHEILPEQALVHYSPKCSDLVKAKFCNEAFAADRSRYMRLWLRIGLKKPLSYVNAWLANSYGFWYPDTVIDVYSGTTVFTFTYGDSSYFGYEVEKPGYRDGRIPWLEEEYRKLSVEISKEKIPIWSMLYSPGAVFWGAAFVLFYVLYRRKYYLAVPCLLALSVWLTVILGPTYLPRYVLIFWFGLPLFAAMLAGEL